jgi:hypothetical protein
VRRPACHINIALSSDNGDLSSPIISICAAVGGKPIRISQDQINENSRLSRSLDRRWNAYLPVEENIDKSESDMLASRAFQQILDRQGDRK